MSDCKYPPPLDRLFQMGDVPFADEWEGTEIDYVGDLGLTNEHIPALIEIARPWQDADDYPHDIAGWAPVHAWRALGQLQAVEAVEPLLAMLSVLSETADEYHMCDFPTVFGMIGPPAIPALTAYLHDPENHHYAKDIAGEGLCQIGLRHPATRSESIAALAEELARFEENDSMLNACLVRQLVSLKAVEAAETIERAFAADCVVEDICGYWGTVRQSLGVAGLGLAPDGPPPPPQRDESPRPFVGPLTGAHLGGVPLTSEPDHNRKKQQEKATKSKRKQQEKAKKRNRKRK